MATVPYGNRYYVVRVLDVAGSLMTISFMQPTRGNWKWGPTDEGTVVKALST